MFHNEVYLEVEWTSRMTRTWADFSEVSVTAPLIGLEIGVQPIRIAVSSWVPWVTAGQSHTESALLCGRLHGQIGRMKLRIGRPVGRCRVGQVGSGKGLVWSVLAKKRGRPTSVDLHLAWQISNNWTRVYCFILINRQKMRYLRRYLPMYPIFT